MYCMYKNEQLIGKVVDVGIVSGNAYTLATLLAASVQMLDYQYHYMICRVWDAYTMVITFSMVIQHLILFMFFIICIHTFYSNQYYSFCIQWPTIPLNNKMTWSEDERKHSMLI